MVSTTRKTLAICLLAISAVVASNLAVAQSSVPKIFADADLELGTELIEEHKCTACHISKVGGDGMSVYKPGQRLTTAGFLRGMVEQCNTELGLGMFPEDVSSVAAVLNRDHYKFTD